MACVAVGILLGLVASLGAILISAVFQNHSTSDQPSGRPFVICEVSANHNRSLENCLRLLDAIAKSGASVVKFQHFKPESLTLRSTLPDFLVGSGTIWDGARLIDVYSEAAMPWEWTERLGRECTDLGLEWFSTAFDIESADFLESQQVSAFKIASFELVDTPLVAHVARKGRPVLLSTGMASLQEIDEAVRAVRSSGNSRLALLRCNSSYPANPSEMDLVTIEELSRIWSVPVGLSDHTLTNTSAIVAVALGARFVEKHVTLDRSDGGPDSLFSLEPDELKQLVTSVSEAYDALGEVRFGPSKSEVKSLPYRRSLRVSREISRGELLTRDNVKSVRPSGGLHPRHLEVVLGCRARRDLSLGHALSWFDLEPEDPRIS